MFSWHNDLNMLASFDIRSSYLLIKALLMFFLTFLIAHGEFWQWLDLDSFNFHTFTPERDTF